ncbi:MAG: TIGR02147 family protein [Pseudobdellovibrionaceae bacterium]|nr:TIGR02147 family protein [Bdellovibrionales bacterium]USN46115.1 MAG: TIGR02147 family protein [Pseudobdellovibrionaceae bacterium]
MTPNVRTYQDYRQFLKDFAEYKRRQNSHWSYGTWAHSLGLKATTSISMIINGQRHPGEQILHSLVEYFGFSPNEESHFRNLVALAKSNETHLKNILKKEVHTSSLKQPRPPISRHLFSQIFEWHFMALRQLARMGRLTTNSQITKRQLLHRLSEKTIQMATEKLIHLRLLELDSEQKLVAPASPLSTQQDIPDENIRAFHQQMISLAAQSVQRVSVKEREIVGLTIPISRAKLRQAKELIRKFASEFDALMDDTQGDAVYQLNVQFFPLAEGVINDHDKEPSNEKNH